MILFEHLFFLLLILSFLLKLFKEGILTGTQMALLKSKYIDLQNALAQ
jgi:hypothetical protein